MIERGSKKDFYFQSPSHLERSSTNAEMTSPRLSLALLFVALTPLSNVMVSAAEYRGAKLIAHRGAGFEFDENTVAGCEQSYGRGIRGFEVDLRLTRDNQLVIMHDSDVARTTGGSGKIEEMTLDEVKRLRTKAHGVPIPTAADLFAYFKDKPDVYLLLEMKTSEQKLYPEERLAKYCQLLHDSARDTLPRGTYCFTSFDRRSLAQMKRVSADCFTGLITGAAPTPELIGETKKLGCGRLSVPLDATPRKFAREVREAGLELSLWPIKTVEDANLAAAFGAAIICTDIPSQLLGKKTAAP
jgi:glycerophosphoryl diester phosphodiesterase